jgi:hypothetical protein
MDSLFMVADCLSGWLNSPARRQTTHSSDGEQF